MPTIAIVGAGPGMGLAIARTFGGRGFDVALVARTKEKLQTLVDQLAHEGIKATAFPADVMDRDSLTDALNAAKAHFGGIDVLEYSPAPHSPVPGLALAVPSEVTVENLQPQIDSNFYGAVTVARAVLPAMREAGAELTTPFQAPAWHAEKLPGDSSAPHPAHDDIPRAAAKPERRRTSATSSLRPETAAGTVGSPRSR
ncbi:SDR family oxidoreductase [Streptomyces thinghirensis]|uniref:SDR family NAD(P)-dependent oxidoreductase n=1 Tax=Streptomyces thinghirensis TaxID=551547 RepID=A0ABP9T4C3_9ACTN